MGTQADVTRKVRALERQRDAGIVRKAGRVWTVEKWLTHWVENIAAPFVRENTIAGYRVAVNVHLIPVSVSTGLTAWSPSTWSASTCA
jgi:integrase